MKISINSNNKFLQEALTSAGFAVQADADLVVQDKGDKFVVRDKIFAKPVRLSLLIDVLKVQELDFNFFKLDPIERVCFNKDKRVNLTEKEIELLKFFHDSKFVVSKNDLLLKVWGYTSEVETATLETHISRLRQKLKVFCDGELFVSMDGHLKMSVIPSTPVSPNH